jgi:hypothetical protein
MKELSQSVPARPVKQYFLDISQVYLMGFPMLQVIPQGVDAAMWML